MGQHQFFDDWMETFPHLQPLLTTFLVMVAISKGD